MSPHSSNWKKVESKVGGKVHSKRIPLSGTNNMGMVGDVKLTGYAIEVKSGRYVPKRVTDWLAHIREQAKEGDMPILVMKPFRLHEEIAVLTMSDLSKLINAARGATP